LLLLLLLLLLLCRANRLDTSEVRRWLAAQSVSLP
jgi:hypothetical protein